MTDERRREAGLAASCTVVVVIPYFTSPAGSSVDGTSVCCCRGVRSPPLGAILSSHSWVCVPHRDSRKTALSPRAHEREIVTDPGEDAEVLAPRRSGSARGPRDLMWRIGVVTVPSRRASSSGPSRHSARCVGVAKAPSRGCTFVPGRRTSNEGLSVVTVHPEREKVRAFRLGAGSSRPFGRVGSCYAALTSQRFVVGCISVGDNMSLHTLFCSLRFRCIPYWARGRPRIEELPPCALDTKARLLAPRGVRPSQRAGARRANYAGGVQPDYCVRSSVPMQIDVRSTCASRRRSRACASSADCSCQVGAVFPIRLPSPRPIPRVQRTVHESDIIDQNFVPVTNERRRERRSRNGFRARYDPCRRRRLITEVHPRHRLDSRPVTKCVPSGSVECRRG